MHRRTRKYPCWWSLAAAQRKSKHRRHCFYCLLLVSSAHTFNRASRRVRSAFYIIYTYRHRYINMCIYTYATYARPAATGRQQRNEYDQNMVGYVPIDTGRFSLCHFSSLGEFNGCAHVSTVPIPSFISCAIRFSFSTQFSLSLSLRNAKKKNCTLEWIGFFFTAHTPK